MNFTPTRFPPRHLDPLERTEILNVGIIDVAIALITLVASLGVFWLSINRGLVVSAVLLLHLGVVLIPAGFLTLRWRLGGDLTTTTLLLMATLAGGPVGAGGSAVATLVLWYHRPNPLRLLDWYDYIAGIVVRSHVARIYDELASGRLPPDASVSVPRFTPILTGTSVDEQQRVLGILARRYHSDFRYIMRLALRNHNGLVRTQAAAIASRLDLAEKSQLWKADSAQRSELRDADDAQKTPAAQLTREESPSCRQ
jgi:hypothetical protein